ncbi:restriction endonuclease subunit S [Staphylococcus aureus]|uniref:Type I restriction modification DNA specificity domain-containing protein n=41 Tax=Staphylococcus TaxID=1279 RepID=A0A7Z7QWQ8_STASC|nr:MULTISPECIES: restriction endonuclease subunit S [Staphylococcus]SUN30386.1 type I restriction modification DNA specificity domain-containing protein [Staphylococcus schleiferi]HDH6435423.1 restriction endonuclease subunit S [Staphylococcus aureus MRSA-Lux-30]HDK9251367.1 restriction endonuclease subunit S [Staphylococcus aureus USA200-OR-131]HDK9403648.1 restriction endonuclease subunit S [Staphylococcus aureus USA1100-04031]ABC46687.1 Sau1hsdS1 [Staphylococcus aureus]
MSNTQTKNVPELRFPGFEGEWEEKKVGELLEFKNGLNKGKEYFGSGSSIVNFKDVFNNRSLNTNNLTGKVNVNSKELKNYSVEKGDVFFTRTSEVIGEIGYPSVILNDPENTVFSGFVLRGRPKSGIDLINNNFKRYVFFTNSFRKEMITKSSMTTRALTSGSAINKMKVIYPVSAKEQRKIGDFFSKLDRQIELEEQKLELLQQQKKGYMQKIFSQELRFKDENSEDYPHWENSKIEKYLKERNERSDKGQMLSVTINSGIIKFSELDRKDNSSKDKSNYKVVRKNDIAYNSMRMWQGASGRSNYNGIVSPAYTVLYPTQNTSSLFIGYKFKTHRMIHKFKINSQGLTSDTWNLKYKQLKNINIDIPVLEEQEKIGDFFKKMDILISKQKIKIEILEKEKQSFLQKMFL